MESLSGSPTAITGEVQGIGFDGVPATGARVAAATNLTGLSRLRRAIAGVYGHNWLTGIDYLIDYGAKQIVMAVPGTLPRSDAGHRTVLSWAEGLPALIAEVRVQSGDSFSARFVLDSGTDHISLFGRAAERLLVNGQSRMVLVDSGFGTRELPAAMIILNLDGRPRPTLAVLMSDLRDREEDGLVPTSLFRSVFVSSAMAL